MRLVNNVAVWITATTVCMFAMRWELGTRRAQTIFALPAAAVIAIASSINDTLRSKIR